MTLSEMLVLGMMGGRRAAPANFYTVNGKKAKIAYAPQGAADLAASYVNLAAPGVNNAAPGTAPTHNLLKGWSFNSALSQWIDTGYIFQEGHTFLLQYKNAPYDAFICGAWNGAKGISLVPNTAGGISYWYGAPTVRSPILASGIVGYSGNQPYRNGVKDGATLAAWGGAINVTFALGRMKDFASYLNGDILRFALWEDALTEADMQIAYNQMIADNKGYVAFGDSITAGGNASDAAHRWTNILATAKGWNLQNSGVSGTSLQNTVQNTVNTIGGAVGGNGRDTYAARINYYNPAHVTIMYGLNDLRLNDVAFSAANFANDLGEIVDGVIADGVPAGNIIIGSPPYIPEASYALYGPEYNGGSLVKHADYVAACASVASAKSTKYIDIYAWMVAHGGDALIDDGIHPNDTGHAQIAAAFLSVA